MPIPKKGNILTIKMAGNPLDGAKACFIRQSQTTRECVVEVVEDHPPCKVGDRITVKQLELS